MKNLKVGDRIKFGGHIDSVYTLMHYDSIVYFVKAGKSNLVCPFTVSNPHSITLEEFSKTGYSKNAWTYENDSPIYTEETYAIGDRFKRAGEEYILAQVGIKMCCLVGLCGNYWSTAIKVDNPLEITETEFADICACNYNNSFVKIT